MQMFTDMLLIGGFYTIDFSLGIRYLIIDFVIDIIYNIS